jgi:ribosomal peptide maturation radical SAM protein 1
MVDICLVNMPLASVQRPSLALGLLKSLLARANLGTKVLYPNIWFLDYTGLELFKLLNMARTEDALIDWLFSAVAFPDHRPDHLLYLERLCERNSRLAEIIPTDEIGPRLVELRAEIPEFVSSVANEVLRLEPRIVGCSSTFQQHVAALALLRRIRELDPTVVTMIGGANCESVMGRATHTNFPWVDFVASGEADGLIVPLCRTILERGRDIAADALPDGVFAPIHRRVGYPSSDGGDGVPRISFEGMDDLPVPNYEDYFAEVGGSLYANYIVPGLPIEASRGCWWGQKHHCTFCGLNGGGMHYRAKSPVRLIAEIDALVSRYGISRFEAVDNIIDMQYFETVLPWLAASERNLDLFFETKANLKPAQIELLNRAGVRWIQPGIESMHGNILKLMRKGTLPWNNVQLLRLCRQFGIRVSWAFLVGFPGEDDAWYQEMAEWLPLLSHLPPGGMHMLRYDRYSPYFNQAKEFGLDLYPSELYRFAYPLEAAELFDQVYFFEDAGAPERGRDIYTMRFADRPGAATARAVVDEWRNAWLGTPPNLIARQAGDDLEIEDTRACAVARRHRLSGLHRDVMIACEAARAPAQIADAVARERDLDAAAVMEALAELQRRKLVIELDGRVVSLILYEPVQPFPRADAFPGGHLADRPLAGSRRRYATADAAPAMAGGES